MVSGGSDGIGGRTAFLSGIDCPTSPRAQAAEEGNQHVNVGIRCPSPLPAPARLVARARFDGEKRVSNRASGEPRSDIEAVFLTGLLAGIVSGFQNNTGKVLSELVRLNVASSNACCPTAPATRPCSTRSPRVSTRSGFTIRLAYEVWRSPAVRSRKSTGVTRRGANLRCCRTGCPDQSLDWVEAQPLSRVVAPTCRIVSSRHIPGSFGDRRY